MAVCSFCLESDRPIASTITREEPGDIANRPAIEGLREPNRAICEMVVPEGESASSVV